MHYFMHHQILQLFIFNFIQIAVSFHEQFNFIWFSSQLSQLAASGIYLAMKLLFQTLLGARPLVLRLDNYIIIFSACLAALTSVKVVSRQWSTSDWKRETGRQMTLSFSCCRLAVQTFRLTSIPLCTSKRPQAFHWDVLIVGMLSELICKWMCSGVGLVWKCMHWIVLILYYFFNNCFL